MRLISIIKNLIVQMLNISQVLNISKKFKKGNSIDAQKLLNSLSKKNKNNYIALFQTANCLNLLGDRIQAKKYFIKAIKLNPNYSDAYNKLGLLFRVEDKLTLAEKYFKLSISSDRKNSDAYHNLGNIYKEKKQYSKAIKCYNSVIRLHKKYSEVRKKNLVKPVVSTAKLLECIYFQKGLKKYLNKLKLVSKEYDSDIRISTMSTYVSSKHQIINPYKFCPKPIEYFYSVNLRKKLLSKDVKVKKILSICSKLKKIWEPSARVTRGGFQTIDNLFEKNIKEINILKKTIDKEIKKFRVHNSIKSDLIIKKWPKKYNVRAWFVKLIKQGYQKSHIHPTAWLSGVFYLDVPKNMKKDQGAIKLSIQGYDYPKFKKMKQIVFKPKNYDLVIFPSSLFHSTIPFVSSQKRCVIPFDMVPVKQVKKYSKEQIYF